MTESWKRRSEDAAPHKGGCRNVVAINAPFIRTGAEVKTKLLGSLVVALMLVALGSSAWAAEPITLRVWSGASESELAVVQAIVDEWNAANPDVQVEATMIRRAPGQSGEEALLVALAAGTAPDIYTAFQGVAAYELAMQGVLLDLSSLEGALAAREALAILPGDLWLDGMLPIIPWQTEVTMLQYNFDLMSEVGVGTPPRTYSEFFELARRLQARNVYATVLSTSTSWSSRLSDFYLWYIAASQGRTPFAGGKVNLVDDPAAVAAMEFFYELHELGYAPRMPQPEFHGDAFVEGHMAVQRWGQGGIPYFRENVRFDWVTASPPVPDDYDGVEPPYAYANTKYAGIVSTTRHPEEALRFLEFFISEASDQKLLASGRFPYRSDLAANPAFAFFFEEMPEAMPYALNIAHSVGTDFAPGVQRALEILSEVFVSSVLKAEKDPHLALVEAQERIRTHFETLAR